MIRVFKSVIIEQQLSKAELDSLISDFKVYKGAAIVPEHFGRDVPYDHPNTLPVVKMKMLNIFI